MDLNDPSSVNRVTPARALAGLAPWRSYCFLFTANLVAVAAGQPYVASLTGQALDATYLATVLSMNGGITLVALLLGYLASRPLGLGTPDLDAWLYGRKARPGSVRWLIVFAPLVGLGLGGLLVGLDAAFIGAAPQEAARLKAGIHATPGLGASLLATLYGGIFEETQLRFFILSGLAWILAALTAAVKKRSLAPSRSVFGVAVALSAVLFGIGHLAGLAALGAATPLLVARTIVLNAIPGVAFGLLYLKRGLETAIVAHAFADLALHVIAPAIEGRFV
jgi:membrane protease YdiL (CAAX protease family)